MIKKLLFVSKITAGLPSFFRLLWQSKRLRWSKTGFIKKDFLSPPFALKINWRGRLKKIYLRTFDGDIDIFYEVFWKEIYSLPQMTNQFVKTIVDLGANVGLSGLYFMCEFPFATLLCVEPDKENFSMLQKNFEEDIAHGNVKIMECAVMDKDGSISFVSEEMKYNSKVVPGGNGNTVDALSMNTIMKLNGIDHVDLLKIDVEGSEKFIFSGNTDWLEKVDNILIECHSARDFEVCMKAFQRHRFSVKSIYADPANENLFWAKREYFMPPTLD